METTIISTEAALEILSNRLEKLSKENKPLSDAIKDTTLCEYEVLISALLTDHIADSQEFFGGGEESLSDWVFLEKMIEEFDVYDNIFENHLERFLESNEITKETLTSKLDAEIERIGRAKNL